MLLLARHGETDWNRDHRWQGHAGPRLNETGRRQAAALATRLGDLDAIYSSDSERAHETADIVGRHLGLRVATDARLREVHFGSWEGLTRAEIDAQFAGGFTRWASGATPAPDGGESDAEMAERVLEALSEIAAAHPDGRVLVVTSGGPIRAAQAHVRAVDQATARRELRTVENCGLVEVVIRGDEWSLDPGA